MSNILLLNKILTIGISDKHTFQEIKRIRILNGIAFFGGVILIIGGALIYILLEPTLNPDLALFYDFFFGTPEKKLIAKQDWMVFYPTLDMLLGIIVLITLLFNKNEKFNLSIFFICFIATVFVSFLYLSSGALNIFTFLIPMLLPIVFIVKRKTIYLLIFINTIVIVSLSVILNNNDALFILPNIKHVSLLIVNYLIIFTILYLMISHLKKENEINQATLQEVNEKLQEQSDEIVQQHNDLIEKNKIIENKNQDITSSIVYARHIQNALLSDLEDIRQLLPNSFIFYKPRDIVSGDFYWASQKNNIKIIAAADCTGHGVPGAFMSILGNSLLNEIINDNGITKPAEILNSLRTKLVRALKQKGEDTEIKDGMDISLVSYDEKNNLLQFAGAVNPLYLIRDKALFLYKGDRVSIGFTRGKAEPFTNHEIKIHLNDTIYLFSDGYIDQFGGKEGRKLSSTRFKQILLSIQDEPINKQPEILEKELIEWQQDYEQIDDILVVAVRFVKGS